MYLVICSIIILVFLGFLNFQKVISSEKSYLYLKLSSETSLCLTPLLFLLSGFLLEQKYLHRINQRQCFDALEKEIKVSIPSLS